MFSFLVPKDFKYFHVYFYNLYSILDKLPYFLIGLCVYYEFTLPSSYWTASLLFKCLISPQFGLL